MKCGWEGLVVMHAYIVFDEIFLSLSFVCFFAVAPPPEKTTVKLRLKCFVMQFYARFKVKGDEI